MKKYFSFLAICSLVSFGFVFGAPEDRDELFQTFNEIGITNANIAANNVVNVSALAPDGKLLIGGDFTLYKAISVNRLTRINNDGTLDTTFNPVLAPLTATTIGATGGGINAIAIAPGGTAENYSFFIGGSFTKFNNTDRNRLAKINCTTTGGTQTCALDPDFNKVIAPTTAANTGANNIINAIAIAPGGTAENYSFFIGGSFTKFNNTDRNRLAKINCTTTGGTQTCALDPDFNKVIAPTTAANTGANNIINAIAIAPGGTAENYSFFIGGSFTKFNNTDRNRLAKINCTTTGGTQTCALDPDFNKVIAPTTAANTGANNIINAIAIFPGGDTTSYSVLIGGTFTKYNNVVQNRLAKIVCSDDSGGLSCSLEEDFVGITAKDGADGAIETIAIYNNGIVLIGGAFTKYDDTPRNRIAQLEAGGNLDEGFYNILPFGPDNTVQHLLIQTDGKIVVSGLFDSYSGLVTGRITRLLGMTSSYSAEGCAAGLFYCGFDNSCVTNASQCASCPADFIHQTSAISPASLNPQITPAVGAWGNLADSPTAHAAHAMVALGTKIYVFGGYTINTTEVYDITTNTWQTLAPYPGATGTYGMMAAPYGDKIYTFFQLKTYEYNPANNTWTPKAPIPTSKVQGNAELIDNKIYIISTLGDKKLHIYNPVTDTWSMGADIPVSTNYGEGVVLGGKIYIIGGTSGAHGTHKMVHVYDPCANSWRKITDMTTVSATHSSSVVKGEIYLGGGVPIMDRGDPVYKTFRKYNPTTGLTTSLSEMPFKSYHARSVTVGNMIYALGGCGLNGTTTQYCSDRHTKFAVYNTGATTLNVDENISACYCKPACGEGKYYSVYDNTCKPNNHIVADVFCNKNNVCEVGESCNCGDCTNGGLDDKDACGLSNGVQMYCSRDDEFYLPTPPTDTETFTDRQLFLSTTNSAIFSYDYILGKLGKAGVIRTATPTYNFPLADGTQNKIGISIKSLGAVSADGKYIGLSYRDDKNYMQRGNFSIPGVYFGVSGRENIDFNFTKPIKSFGVDMYESTNAGAEFCNSTCTQSTFTFTAFLNGVQVGTPQTFSPADNQVTFFGFSAPAEFNQVQVRETTGNIDNERFGRIYYQDRSAGAQQCETKKVIAMNTSNGTYADNKATMFFDFVPREVTYNGKNVYVYKILKRTTASKTSIIANPSEAYQNAADATNTFDFIEANLTSTNAAAVFNNNSISYVNGKLLGRLKADGTIQYQFDNAGGGYPFFARTPYQNTGDKVYSQYRDDAPNSGDCPGGVCYAAAPIVGVFDVQVCQPTDQDICSVGACCPAGKKWDCDTNSCIVDELLCPAGQIKAPEPGGAVCLLSITPKTNGSDFLLTGYDNLQGSCTLASSSPNPIASISPLGGVGLIVGPATNTVTATTSASFGTILDPVSIEGLLTCPSGHKTQCFIGDTLGQFSCGCFPETHVKMKINIVDSQNVNTTFTLGNGTKVQNNTAFDLYKDNTYALDIDFQSGDTTDMGIKRQTGYVEFYTHDRLNYNIGGTLRGTITLEGAKIIGVDAPYQKTASLNLEQPNNDFVTQINDQTVSFYSYFSEPGDKWKIYYELPNNVPDMPAYTCQIQGCGEGKYWCSNEGVCKNADETCGVLTCNNDLVCDQEESCDCSDCNSQIDHCGLSATGQQLFCSKDALQADPVPKMKINFSRTENVPNAITLGGSVVVSNNPSFNLVDNGIPIEDSALLYDTPNLSVRRHNGYVEFLARKDSATYGYYTGTITLENAVVNRVEAGLTTYPTYPDIGLESIESDDATKANSTVVNFQMAFAQQGDSFRIYYDLPATSSTPPPTDKWEARSYSSAYIMLSKHPINPNTVAGQTFYVYNPERIIRNMTKAQFLADPTTAIRNATVLPIGRSIAPMSRVQFNMPQLLSETATVQATTVTNLKSSIYSRFLCATLQIGATDCHYNNLGGTQYPGFSYTVDGPIYGSIHDGDGYIQTTAYERLGTFEVACQAYDYTTVRYVPNANPTAQGWSVMGLTGAAVNDAGKLAWQINDTVTNNTKLLYKKLAPEEKTSALSHGWKLGASIKVVSATPNFGLGTVLEYVVAGGGKRYKLVFGLNAAQEPIVMTATTFDSATDSYLGTQYTVTGGADKYHTYEMVYDPVTATVDVFVDGIEHISNYSGLTLWAGGYQSLVGSNSAISFGSDSTPNRGNANFGNVTFGIKNNVCSTPVVPAVVQVGACCPAGTQWNSAQNKCMPNCATGTTWDAAQNKCTAPTCAEGQYYCHSELKCKPANQTCGTVTCNNNDVCNEFESCDCADCNGQIDHCGIVNGEQLFCTKDPAPQCYTDRFPYCFPLCLDGFTLDTATNQCVVSGGASVSPNSAALSTTQIGACCPAGAQWSSANNKCETNCTTTQAPSELKAGIDQPYISCTAGPTGTTHFKYRLTDTSAPTATPFISAIYTNGTQVLHPIINAAGNYKVECFYGNATSVDTGNTATPSTCVKNIVVKNDANTQGCEGLVSYKGTTLTTTLEDTSAFTARFQCINRVSENPAVINPFRIQYASNNFISLGFATVIDPNLSSSIGLNRLSSQNEYTFGLGNTSVTCAVKVGGGYSTNTSCQKNACVGGNCSTPQTFSVVHSDNLTCTTQATAEYKIGCNPDAPQSNRTECVNWLKQMSNNVSPFKAPFIFNGTLYGEVTCTEYPPNDPALGGVNMFANIVCTADLNNGKQYTILAADTGGSPINSLQTTTYTVKKDTTNPDILPLELYLNPSLTLAVTNFDRWYNVPLTVVARCSDKPGISDGDECACAPEMVSSPTFWSPGVAHSEFGPDIMHYTRTISTSTSGITAQVKDTAGNLSPVLPALDLRIDTQAPSVTVTETAVTGSTRTIKLDVSDTLSKIWKTTDTPSGTTNVSGVIYRTGPKADTQALMFDEDCNVSSPLYATISETTALSNVPVNIPSINTNTTVVTYCVQDNAGNVTRGAYPTMSGGCFSASNMPTVPNFDIYKTSLISRITNNQYGYSFSENTADANCFRGILANNVTTLIANQLNPRSSTTLSNWSDDRAIVKNTTSTRNTNGYYYYSYPSSNTLNIDVPPTGSGNKTVVVEGGDIQINTNIDYSGTGKLLVLVARKNNNGQGGNIRIAPSVSRIDAILIADGGALINSDPNAAGQRLTINGRIYSYNTRGGSLVVTGTELTDASQGKKFNNATLTNATSLSESRAQDLERFRVISVDGTAQCSTHLNYQVLPANQLPPILQRPTTFSGTCGF